MNAALQITGFLLALAGTLLAGVCLAGERWKTSTVHDNVITSSYVYENLWKSCAEQSTGVSSCKSFDSVLALPGFIQACRALMIISIILGLIACIVSLFGLKCIKVGSSDEHSKGKISLGGGLLFIVADDAVCNQHTASYLLYHYQRGTSEGLCCIVAVSWYAARITSQFFDPLYAGTKYELGSALYIGWAGSLLAILGGCFLCCSFKKKKKTNKKGGYKYNYPATDNDFTQFKERKDTSATSKAYV